MQTPFKTPDGFFESHRKAIWDAAQSNAHDSLPATFVVKPKAPLAIAAAVAAVIIGTWFFAVLNQAETCQTFACLWDNTQPEELQFSEEDLDQWIQDDLLFQEIMESEALL
jgi:hypothetical protein